MIIPNKLLANQKMEQLKKGENAFAESGEVLRILERNIAREKLDVVMDKSPAGCWIIPENQHYQEMRK